MGRDRVRRFLLGTIRKAVPEGVRTRLEEINGRPGLIYSPLDGRAGCVVTFDVSGGCIQNIYVITNPEKLVRLPKFVA